MSYKSDEKIFWILFSAIIIWSQQMEAQVNDQNPKIQTIPATRAFIYQKAEPTIHAEVVVKNGFAGFGPYNGPVHRGVDASTLDGKVMCGYQGWFGAPGDGSSDQNWHHWTKHKGPMQDGNARVDLWPDVSELSPNERFPTNFKLSNGQSAEVFSSFEKPTVLRHFRWMQDYGIDGVFVQRFGAELHGQSNLERCNTVLANCREGANRYGRTYAVMYDLSGMDTGQLEEVMKDWQRLRAQMRITDDPAYLHHNGKPVVAIWGVGFNDQRKYTLDECLSLIKLFKNDAASGGCTLMVGVPTYWRDMVKDSVNDPKLHEILGLADIISPWTVGRYRDLNGIASYGKNILASDIEWCQQKQIGYMPVVFPGFSWYNIRGEAFNFIPRLRGQFLWSQFLAVKKAGVSMVYVAMFDEVDEGTAIFKCISDVPVGQQSKFLGYEGLPNDYYLKMVGTGTKLIQGKIKFDAAAMVLPKNIDSNKNVFIAGKDSQSLTK